MKTGKIRLTGILAICLAAILTLVSCAGMSPVKFEVSFVVDGEVYDTVSTNGAETIKLPADPTKDGYIFRGWYWDEGKWEQPFTANSLLDAPLTNNMRVYARFEAEGGGGVTPDPDPDPNPTPDGAKTISAIKAGTVGESYTVTAWVVGINSQSFLIEDATGKMLVYMGAGFEYRQLAFGDKVTVSGTTSVYGGAVQFAKGATFVKEEKAAGDYAPTIPTAKKPTAAELDAYATATNIEPEYIEVTGTLSISNGYYNIDIEGATITGSVSYIISELEGYLAEYDGKAVTVYGYVTGAVSGGKYLNLMVLDFNDPATPGPGPGVDPEPEIIEGTIVEIKAGEVGKTYKTTAKIVAANAQSFLIEDETGKMLVYIGSEFDYMSVVFGDVVTVTGTTSLYGGAVQFAKGATVDVIEMGDGKPNIPTPKEPGAAELDEYITASTVEIEFIKVTGILTISNGYYNLAFDGATIIGSISYVIPEMTEYLAQYNGKELSVMGYVTGVVSGGKYLNIMALGFSGGETPDPGPGDDPTPDPGPGDDPTPDPEPEVIEGTIAEIKAGEIGKTYKTTAKVAMFNAQSFLIYDDTGMILVYTGAGLDYMSLMPNTKVTVTGITSVYGGAIQFGKGTTYEILEAGNGQPIIPTMKEPTPAELDAYATATVIDPRLVEVTGILTIDGSYYNLAFDGAGIIGSISYVVPELAEMLAEYNGKTLTVMGYVTGTASNGKFLDIMVLGFQGGSSGGESGGTEGGDNEGGNSGEGSDDGKIHVTFYHTMGMSLQSVLDYYIEEFRKMYPNIVIDHEQVGGYDDVRDTIKYELAAGGGPDIAYCYPDHVALYNRIGKVSALDDFIASQLSDGNGGIIGMTEAEQDAFIDSFLEEGRQYGDGLTYSLPFSKSTEVLYYNKTFFESHGLKVPTTWDEMEETLARIKKIDPYSVPLGYDSEANLFITLCEQLGGLYVDEDNNFIFNNDTVKDMVKRIRTWYQNGWMTTQELYGAYTSSLFTQTGEDACQCYMVISSSAGARHHSPGVDENGEYLFEVGIAPVPQIDISNPKAIMQGPSLCIFNHGDEERLTAAWLFMKFLTTCPELQAEFSLASGYMPVSEATLENEAYVEYLESANGYENVTALAIKAGFEQSDAYYSASAFVGSADAREIVGRLLRDCIIYDGEDVGAYIDEAFKNAVESCEMYR